MNKAHLVNSAIEKTEWVSISRGYWIPLRDSYHGNAANRVATKIIVKVALKTILNGSHIKLSFECKFKFIMIYLVHIALVNVNCESSQS